MSNIMEKLESHYNVNFCRAKCCCPQSIRYIVEQFVNNKWITDVEYYCSTSDHQFVICGKTKMHHDVFYFNPLTKMLWTLGCQVHPNKHCRDILGEGCIVIHIPHVVCQRIKQAEGDFKGVDAFVRTCVYFLQEMHIHMNNQVSNITK